MICIMKKKRLHDWMLLAVLSLFLSSSLFAQSVWSGASTQDWTGSGTESDPYLIKTAEQLAGLGQAVREGCDFQGEFIRLANDLWLSDASASHADKPQWIPIGGITYKGEDWEYVVDTTCFRGTFDGAGHSIYNLYYNTLPDMSDWDDPFGSGMIDFNGWNKALFGYLDGGAIRNLHLVNDTIIGAADIAGLLIVNDGGIVSGCTVSGLVVSGSDETGGTVGGLVGKNINGGIIENCSSAADVKSPRSAGCLVSYNEGVLRNCSASGKAYCSQYYVGGLVATNAAQGEILRCHSTGYVSRASYTHAMQDCGGFVGNNLGLIRECWSSATVNSDKHGAGFCGLNGGRIESCYATGDVTIRLNGSGAATFVGANGVTPSQALDPVVYEGVCINCFATGKCKSEDAGTLSGFLSGYQTRENRATLTVFCTTDSDRFPYNDKGLNRGGVTPGIKGGALRRSTAVMQSRAFVDTLNMVAAVAGTCMWQYREGNYPVPTGQPADITLCFSGGGDGSKENPFRISTKEELERVADLVGMGWTFQGQYLRLENDIMLNAPFEEWGETAPVPWNPIGKYVSETTSAGSASFVYEFRGTFDGASYSVQNLYINTVQDDTPQGLFGVINGATLRNLNVTNAWIKAAGSPGILVGEATRYCMPTHILQCHTSGRVEGKWSSGATMGVMSLEGITNVINCSSSATLIKGSYSAHPVAGDQNYFGGPAYSNDTVANFYFSGVVENYGISFDRDLTTNCYYNSDLNQGDECGRTTAYLQSPEFANELNYYVARYNVQHADDPLSYWQNHESAYPTLTVSVPPHTVTYHTGVPDLVYVPQPVLDDSHILPPPIPEQDGKLFYGWFTDEQMTHPYIFEEEPVTSSFSLYAKWQSALEPDITPFTSNPFATTYIIRTPEQLYGFALAITGKQGVIDKVDFTGKTVKLDADILLNDTTQWRQFGKYTYGRLWEPLGADYLNDVVFRGTFDGNGHTIAGLYIHRDDFDGSRFNRQGLFGTISPEATVRNLNIKASRIITDGWYGSLGLLAGWNRGKIENCHVEGEIEAACCTSGLLVGVSSYEFGGIGLNNGIGRITNSSAVGRIHNSEATFEVSAGGLVGKALVLQDSIIGCTASVSVIHEGTNRPRYVGGLIGSMSNTVVQDCFACPDTLYASESVGGLVGFMNQKSALIRCRAISDLHLDINYLGGLVGRADGGDLTDCHAEGRVISSGDYIGGLAGCSTDTLSYCSASGVVSGKNYVGGLIGRHEKGKIFRCYATAAVSGNTNVGGFAGATSWISPTESFSTGDVQGEDYVGGFIGRGGGTDCFARGSVSGNDYVGGFAGTIQMAATRCYATGSVTASGESVSGFGVASNPLYITSSYYDQETSGQSDNNQAQPAPTLYMKNKHHFENWNFENIWGRKDTINDGYPYLRWIYPQYIEDDSDTPLPPALEGILLNPETAELKVGDLLSLEATAVPSDAVLGDLVWESSDPSIASVNVRGEVSALSAGEVLITVSTSSGSHSATCRITVESEQATSVSDLRKDGLSVYPNPVVDLLYLRGDSASVRRLEFIDLGGHSVLTTSYVPVLNVSHLPEGIYMLRIITDSGRYHYKIIKVRQ